MKDRNSCIILKGLFKTEKKLTGNITPTMTKREISQLTYHACIQARACMRTRARTHTHTHTQGTEPLKLKLHPRISTKNYSKSEQIKCFHNLLLYVSDDRPVISGKNAFNRNTMNARNICMLKLPHHQVKSKAHAQKTEVKQKQIQNIKMLSSFR